MKLGFFRGTGFFAWLVRVWTGGEYCHCEIVFSDGVFFGCNLDNGWSTSFHDYNAGWLAGPLWHYVDVPVSKADEAKIRAWCETEADCPYDWWGLILSQVLFWNRQNPNKWFCSEVTAAALQQVGFLPPKPPAVQYCPSGRRGLLEHVLEILGRQ